MDPADQPIRVLWLIMGLGPGGAERLLANHARIGNHESFTYRVAFLLPEKNHLVAELRMNGVGVSCLGARPRDARWVLRLRRLLLDHPVDVVHCHSPRVASAARLVALSLPRAVRPALVYTEHNRWATYRRPTRWLNRVTYPLDDAQFAVSEGVRESVPSTHRDRLEVMIHGVEPEVVWSHGDRTAAREELGVTDGEVVIGTVAHLRQGKAYDNLVAAARIVADHLQTVRFVAIGQGPLDAQIRSWVGDCGLADRFRLLGYRRDAVRLISGFDVFVLASDHEGLPVSVMESLALGVPVVATSVGGLPEVVQDGVEGRLVPPRRPELLADALVSVAEDQRMRLRMAEAARTRAAAFDSAGSVRRLEAVYREVAPCAE